MTPTQTAKRIGRGTLKSENWVQLFQFGLVGASGYLVNLAVFAVLNGPLGIHYIGAAILAFCVAVMNNFWWNRHWTFDAKHGHAGFQAARFLVVSLVALGFNLLVLELLVSVGDVAKIPAQAVAILAATPLNFVGNKLWSFHKPTPRVRQNAAG
jgi:dolichol-phosphate mannosyltransferase